MDKIVPSLWFEKSAEEAAEFYVSLFDGSRILDVARYTDAGPGETGSAMTVTFELAGQRFLAINGGPHDEFNDAVSFQIQCEDQAEVDRLWDALTAHGGREVQCGWCKDRYGMSWQVIPKRLGELLSAPDREAADRAMKAMLGMKKIDVGALERAAAGEE
jgi:predicted 3-demethylubiquinone-9 3-methyltransferase (glyoxalase superfamily)